MKSESSSVFLRLAKIIPLSSLSARLNNFQTLKVRLSNHATFAALQCDVKDFPTSDWFNLFSSIKEKDLYNYIHLNHNSFPLNKCHGPYNFSNLNDNSFNLIDGEFFYKAIEDILKKEHWLQPPIDNSKVSILSHRAKDLSKRASVIYVLDKTMNIPIKPYDHEWSHAFIEFYEFFIVTSDQVFIWSLIYE